MLETFLYWSGGREPEDWEDEWGDLPDEFQSPRLQVGDRLTFFVSDSEGSTEIVLKVERVEFHILANRSDAVWVAIRDQHVWVSEAEPEDETADKSVDKTVEE